MHVLLVSRAALVASYRPKLAAIAAHPDIRLDVVIPPRWNEAGRVQHLEPGDTPGYTLHQASIARNGSFHTHWYPRLGRRIAEMRPDIVQIEEEPYNLATLQIASAAARAHSRVVCVTWQNIARRYPPPFSLFHRRVLRLTDHLVCGSPDAARVWRSKGYEGPTTVIPIGVDPTVWHRDDTPPAERPFTIGYLGRFVPEKGVEVLVDAFERIPGEPRLVLAGEGPLRESLATRASRSPAATRMEIRGWIPSAEVPARLQDFDALVVPSLTRRNWKEQFGRVLIEAMAVGVPVVGSSSGEIPEVIGDAGIVVPEGDVAALAGALGRLAREPRLREDLSASGARRVLEQFTWERVARQSVEVFRSLERAS